jgi:ComF family protein
MNIFKSIFNLFYPDICLCCKEQLTLNETIICLDCRFDLPLTHFSAENNNLVERSFYGRIPLKNGTALFYYSKKGKVQELIHQLKYKSHQEIGTLAGHWLGSEIAQSKRFKSVDCIIPVPLHKKKLKKRGYNQVTSFGQSLSEQLGIPYLENELIRISSTKTQTKKFRLDRWKNVQEIFYVQNPKKFNNKHILLIDDVITTGATIEACYNSFSKINNFKFSIACIAYTK